MADKKQLFRKSYALKSEVSNLKHQLDSLNSKRKTLYTSLDSLRLPFRNLVEKIKGFRANRDEHTASVRELKSRRQSAHSEAKTVAAELRKLREEKDKKSRDLGVRRPASVVAAEIKKMEFRIETGAIPFEQEQKLNKLIKEKKNELRQAEQLTGVVAQLKVSSEKLSESKSKSDVAHQELQLHASVSQRLHEEMLANAKKADELKEKIRPIEEELSDVNKKSSELKKQLRQKLSELAAINKVLDKIKAEEDKRKKLEQEKLVAERERQLTEKMKAGKKLTMDDLIMLQKE